MRPRDEEIAPAVCSPTFGTLRGEIKSYIHMLGLWPPLLLALASPLESPGWATLQKSLDVLPVFTVANAEGAPLEYEVDGKPQALFYADVEAAKKELSQAQGNFPELECDLIPVGLGSAYALTCQGKAIILPGVQELSSAGAPPGAVAMGQPLPLFACMEISRENGDGKPELPLFMSYSDCKTAVSQATDADAPGEELEIVGLSLSSVIERLVTVSEETPAFMFVPPSASSKFISEYLAG